MISLPPHVRVHVALGYTDLRKGIDGLSVLVQETLRADPFSGHVFVFRGRKAGLIKLLYHDGNGMCLYAKRLDQGIFTWPVTPASPGEPATVLLTPARLSMLLEGLDWRAQGRFNRSSQHPILRGDDDDRKTQIRALDAAQIILARTAACLAT